MSGAVSGITKIFSSIGTGVAKLGNAVRAVGGSLFQTSAATGSSISNAVSSGGGGFFSSLLGGGSTLGNMLSGVASVMGLGPPGSVSGLAGAAGGLGSAAATAATTVPTATGMAPSFLSGLGSSIGELAPELALGALTGWGEKQVADAQNEALMKYQQAGFAQRDKESQRITDSYQVPQSALVGGQDNTQMASMSPPAPVPPPQVKRTRPEPKAWKYVNGQIQLVGGTATA